MQKHTYIDTKSTPTDAKIAHTHIYSHKPRNGVTTCVDTVTHCLMSHFPKSIADILPLPECVCVFGNVCVCPWALLLNLWQSCASLGRDVCLSVCSLLSQGLTRADIEVLHTHTHTCHHGHRHKDSGTFSMTALFSELFLLP